MKTFTCTICQQKFKCTYQEFRQHIVSHKKEKSFKPLSCDLCKKRFSSKQSLTYHLNSFHNFDEKKTRVFQCHFCNKSFKDFKVMKLHITRLKGL